MSRPEEKGIATVPVAAVGIPPTGSTASHMSFELRAVGRAAGFGVTPAITLCFH